MSENSTGGREQHRAFRPPDNVEGDYALLHGAGTKIHVVDTTTFDNSERVMNPDGSEYEGYSANVGTAETLCGHELVGRMCPLEPESPTPKSRICGNCRRSLHTGSQQPEGEPDD